MFLVGGWQEGKGRGGKPPCCLVGEWKGLFSQTEGVGKPRGMGIKLRS